MDYGNLIENGLVANQTHLRDNTNNILILLVN